MEAATQGPDTSTAQSVALTLWSDTTSLTDLAATAAVVGRPLEDLRSSLRRSFESARDANVEYFSAQEKALSTALEDLRLERTAIEEECRTLGGLRSQVLATMREAGLQLAECASSSDAIIRIMQAKRFPHRTALDDSKDAHRHDSQNRELAHARGLAEARAEVSIADRAVNSANLENVQRERQRQLQATEEQFVAVRASNHELQQSGLTRGVGRFLTWTSFFAFGGIGIFLGHVLAGQFGNPVSDRLGLAQLKAFLGGSSVSNPLAFFGQFVLLFLAMLAVFAAIWALAYWLLMKLDPSWTQKTARRRGWSPSVQEELGGWLSFLGIAPPGLGRKTEAVDRRLFFQMVAVMPLVTLAALMVFLWIATSDPAVPGGFQSIDSIYLGASFVVLTASNGLLLWLFVIRPAIKHDSQPALVKAFYSLLFVTPIAAAVFTARAGMPPTQFSSAVLGAALASAVLGLSHGIYLRGLFSREDFLERALIRQRNELETLLKLPTAEDYLDDAVLRDQQKTWRRSLKQRWQNLWQRFGRYGKTRHAVAAASDLFVELTTEGLVPEILITQLNDARKKQDVAKALRDGASEERTQLDQRLAQLSTRLGECVRQIDQAVSASLEAARRRQTAIVELDNRFEYTDFMICQAYALAQFATRTRP